MSRAWVLAFALIGSACGYANEAGLATTAPRVGDKSCTTSKECGLGSVCITSRCVREPRATDLGRVHFEVTPPPEAPYVRTHFLDQPLAQGGADLALVLPAPAVFTSRVLAADQPIAARVSVLGSDRIPGRGRERSIYFAADSDTELRLLPGDYAIQLEPIGVDAPGWETQFLARRSSTVELKTFELPEDFTRIEGEVVLRTMSQTKLEGVTVRAFADPSGLPSTKVITDADGRFTVVLPKAESTRSFQLVAAPAAQPAWSYERSGLTVDAIAGRTLVVNLEGTSTAAIGRARIRVLGLGAAGPVPIPGARVVLTASTALDVKVFRAEATTDQDGYLTSDPDRKEQDLALLSAKYEVSIDPPASSPFRRTVTTLDLLDLGPAAPADEQIEILEQIVVQGSITTALGGPLLLGQIELEALDDPTARLVETRTDERGAFTVRLDPGRYVARIAPDDPLGDGELIPVGLEEIEVPDDQPIVLLDPITLPAGAGIRGFARGDDGSALPGTDVEVFAQIGERSISLGRTTTGAMGDFSIVLPAPK